MAGRSGRGAGRSRLALTREAILAHRRRAGALDERLAHGPAAIRQAAWAGLQDSMPRAAVLSLHARVAGIGPSAWADPALVQVWGPRYSAYAVPAEDRAVFTLGRLPETPKDRAFAEQVAAELAAFLDGRTMSYADAGHAMGLTPNRLRYAAPTGTVVISWDGARSPTVRSVPRPEVDPHEAGLELARRHLHVVGPSTPDAFARWAGVPPPRARARYAELAPELLAIDTPIGEAWILARDEPSFRAHPDPPATARLLPSGDAYWLLQGRDRELVVPDARRRGELWTPRVWPGALLVAGEVVGTWRRAGRTVEVAPWRSLSADEQAAVEAEAASFPLPDVAGPIEVRWTA